MVDPGNTLATALNIGTLSGTQTFTDNVGPLDSIDLYRFSLTQTSRVNLSLSGLTDDTTLQIIADRDGDGVIDFDEDIRNDFGDLGDNAIVNADLSPGTYYALVSPTFSNRTSNYSLRLTPTVTPPTTPSNPGNTLASALNIGTLSTATTFKDNVGPLDSSDLYRFSLTQASRVNLSLSGLTDDITLQIVADRDGDGVIDFDEDIRNDFGDVGDNAVVNADLGPGTYFALVTPTFSDRTSNYTLAFRPTATPPTTSSNPGNTLATALNIGTLTTAKTFRDNVGPLDSSDLYRFSLTQTSRVNLSLSGLTDDITLQIIADRDGDGVIDFDEDIRNDFGDVGDDATVVADLGPGTYYALVSPTFSDRTSNYTLTFRPTATPPTTSSNPGNTLATALNIGTLSSPETYKDNVGPLDSVDLYRFSLTQTSNVNVLLSGLSDDAELQIIADLDRDGVIDFNEDIVTDFGDLGDDAIINTSLAAGTYFALVQPTFSDRTTNYTLDLYAATTTPSAGDDYIIGTIANEMINALSGNDRLDGRAGDDRFNGSLGNDTLNGEEGNDNLLGGDGNDVLIGSLDKDVLAGNAGRDTLTGGEGQDRFAFASVSDRIDVITDFVAVDDTISISAAGFGGGLVKGALPSSQFILGAAAGDASDRLIYNQTTGALFFDIDGSGATAQVQIATLAGRPALSSRDILVIT
jgi:Ca2+-binding RTX toxin-like protein